MASGEGRGRGPPYQGNRGASNLVGVGRGRGATSMVEVFSQGAGVTQPSSIVQQTEDATMKSTETLSLEPIKLNATLPLRPGYGTQGKKITLWANYFELTPPKTLLLYRYSVEHLPDIKGKKLVGRKGRWVVKLMLQTHFANALENIATDYSNTIVSTSELPLPQNVFEIQYRSEQDDEPRQGAGIHRLKIAPTENHSILQFADLMHYLTSTNINAEYSGKNELIQAANIIIRFQPRNNSAVITVGENKHFPINEAHEFKIAGGGLKILRGYVSSARPATSRLLLNVQVKHAAFYEAIPLALLVQRYASANGQNLRKLQKFLKGLRVNVMHITRKNAAGQIIPHIRTIFGLATGQDGHDQPKPPIVRAFGSGADDVQFFLGGPSGVTDAGSQVALPQTVGKSRAKPAMPPGTQQAGEYITVTNYFKRVHNKYVQNTKVPVINVGDQDNPSYLPVDACTVLPGQPSCAKLNLAQTQEMISFAVRKPVQNAKSITTNGASILGLGSEPNTILRKFNISVSATLISVLGRILVGPPVQYRNSKTAKTKFGSWNMEFLQFSSPTVVPRWSYLWVCKKGFHNPWTNHDQLKTTMDLFQRNLRVNGLNADNLIFPGLSVLIDGETQDDTTIELAFDKVLAHPQNPRLMLVILPFADTAIYNKVKHLGDVKKGIHTICVVASKFSGEILKKKAGDTPDKMNAQYFANVALKFNLKLGGINQTLSPDRLGVLAEGKTMVVGLDVTHPSPGSVDSAPSVAGIVATVDKALGQWPADLRMQTSRQEMVDNLDELFTSRLRLWQAKNKSLPENILLYRDGVSEGQYETVLNIELPQIREACRKLYPASDTKNGIPRVSIIVVGKRHNTHFYPTRVEDADRSSNPQNGTIVDRGVTEARNWDFFLQAHTALQGTARPAHYYVILDEIFRMRRVRAPHRNAADQLEELTHNLCYLFGRATKAVSICPPAYYADLVCERARCYLSDVFDATPNASVAESGVGGGPIVDPDAVKVHPNLKDTMFYI